jgi:hypothetical protein
MDEVMSDVKVVNIADLVDFLDDEGLPSSTWEELCEIIAEEELDFND